MLTISENASIQTVITTYDVTPGSYLDLIEELRDAFENVISKQPGFIAAAIHGNEAQTRIANYSQWASREDFKAMLRSDEMRARNQRFSELSRSFEPVLYDVQAVAG